jgi:alkaline phosphatase D
LLTLLLLAACRPADQSAPAPAAAPTPAPVVRAGAPLTNIAFGSCLDQTRPMPILATVEASKPDLFAMLGDNVYADPTSAADLQHAYAKLAADEHWASLRRHVPIVATWDDHDFGLNDAGKENTIKAEAKQVMLDFFDEPADSPRRVRDGIYDARIYGPQGRRVQLVMLDTRWFRDALIPGDNRYVPHPEPGPTVLGEAQWTWLEAQLREPAELRLLISGIQVIVGEHGWESWGLFPAERGRLLTAIGKTNGVVILSGDRHRGEISCMLHPAVDYPLYEVTSSSLNKPLVRQEANRFRLPDTELVVDANFGAVRIAWEQESLTLALHDAAGRTRVEQNIVFDDLRRGASKTSTAACIPF